ncbi:MAG: glutamyl-tRNA reductase [Phycisphaeraceae bacterium]
MRIVMLSISHRTAPVELRERLALSGERLDAALAALRALYPLAETVMLSTCNRMELFVARPEHEPPMFEHLDAFLADFCDVKVSEITAAALHREQDQAVAHLFRVATGMESMVLGEPQILGQVKRAYEQAAAKQAVGPVLHRIFQQAITVAKQVRNQTGIDEGRVSVSSVAVDLVRQIFSRFDDKTVVAIGAGEMAKITLRHLQALRPAKLWLTNRTRARADALAGDMNLTAPAGGVRPFEELDELLVEADIVLTSTGATHPIITAERMRPLIRRRRSRPIVVIDIAVPRDVEPGAGSLSNVYLYNIDDLQKVVLRTQESRSAQMEQCEKMVLEAVRSCMASVQHRDLGNLIKALRDKLHDFARNERQRTLKKLATTSADRSPDKIEAMLDEHDHRLVNKILHLPLSQLDPKNPDAPLAFFAAALRRLFALEESASEGAEPGVEAPENASEPAPPRPAIANEEPSPDDSPLRDLSHRD